MNIYRAALILVAIVNLFAVVRIFWLGVQRTFPMLASFLIYQLFQNVSSLIFSPFSPVYQAIYTYSEPLNWILFGLLVMEFYKRAFTAFPGIASFARYASYLSVAVAIVISVLLLRLNRVDLSGKHALFSEIAVWEKLICFAFAVFIAFMIFVVCRYPIRLQRNVVVGIAVFTVYFAGTFFALQFTNPTPYVRRMRNYGLIAVYSACYVAWGILLRRPGDSPEIQVGFEYDDFEANRLMTQLQGINNMLAKPGRK